MDQAPLVKERIDAGTRFLSRFGEYAPVVVALWLRDSETGRWFLNVASDHIQERDFARAYGEVVRIAREMRDPDFDPFQVRLVGMRNPLVRAALDVYKVHPPKIPLHVQEGSIGGTYVEEAYLVKGPTGEYTMPTGREALNLIIDQEADFFQKHGRPPAKIKLPVLMAYDLAKCGRDELGELSGRVFKDGIDVFEREGFHGMAVEILRDPNAKLEFE